MPNIADFLSQMSGGGARNNQFKVTVPFPGFAIGTGTETEQLEFLIRTANLPASTVEETEVFFRGRQIPIAGERTFEAWEIEVLNDTDFALRDAFERWSNAVAEHSTPNGIINPTEYMVDFTAQQLDRNDNVLKTYNFVGGWPQQIGAIELSQEEQGTIETFDVSMRYIYWDSNTTS